MIGSQTELTARIDALEAIEAVAALKSRYWRAIDAGSTDSAADCLADDAVIDFEGMGCFTDRKSFLAAIQAAAAGPKAFHMHHGRNPRITVTGKDSAEGEWDIFYQGIIPDAALLIQMAGEYHDRYVRRDGRWWIAAMTMRQRSFVSRSVGVDGAPAYTALPGESALSVAGQD